MVEASVFDGDGDVTGDGEKQFKVVAREIIAVHGLAEAENGDGAFAETAGNEIIEVEFFESAADGLGFLGGGARGFKEQAATGKGWAGWVEKRKIERAFGTQAHGAGKHKAARSSRVLQENREAIDQQGLRDAIEHGTDQRFEADFVGERAAEFDQGAAIIEAIAIEEAVEARLHPFAQGFDEESGDDDGDDAADGPGGKAGAMK